MDKEELLEQLYRVLGPNVPSSMECQGCMTEWGEALKLLREHAPEEVARVDAQIARRGMRREIISEVFTAMIEYAGRMYPEERTKREAILSCVAHFQHDGF
jgi:hypothetical protein